MVKVERENWSAAMACKRLQIHDRPELSEGRLVLAFSGWMDGGEVSTGTVEWLANTMEAYEIAEIDPEGFYIYNFPGSMEISALFRPYVEVEEGLIQEYEPPTGTFYCVEEADLVLFAGKEPNFNWREFANCLFELGDELGVKSIYFVGSFGGTVPHTREPRLYASVSEEKLKEHLNEYGVKYSDYRGPASFITYLMTQAQDRGFEMVSLVAEIPAYVEGANAKSIEAVVRKLTSILGVQVDMQPLRTFSDEWERRLNAALKDHPDLEKHIRKLEEDYDNEVFDTEMGDLKQWLEQRGLRVD